jgi:uncharacterized protein
LKCLDTLVLGLTSNCNLKCHYCHNSIYYDNCDRIQMSLGLALKSIQDYVDYVKYSGSRHAVVCLTGGEPLTCGLDYFSDLLIGIEDIQKRNDISVNRDLVTNATLISPEYVTFFKDHDINISLSIDGPPNITNSHRKFRESKNDVADSISRSVDLLKSRDILFGVLATITSSAVGHESELLKYFQSLEPGVIAFNPCVDKGPSLDPVAYGFFLSRFFDEWVSSGKYYPGIRTYRYFLQRMTGSVNMDIPCEWNNDCPNTVSISADGKMWACEMYMGSSNGFLGDVRQQSILEIVASEPFKVFRNRAKTLLQECLSCDAFDCCNGGCAHRRTKGKDYLCEATRALYYHIREFLKKEVWNPLSARRASNLSETQ